MPEGFTDQLLTMQCRNECSVIPAQAGIHPD